MDKENPPWLPSWKSWYLLLIAFLALQVALYYYLGKIFGH
jgi:hypothetical protein